MKKLLQEIHRRSLWQVLGVYLAGSWVALQVVEQLTNAAGLPDWVQPFALVLLVVGLPIVLATAFIQVGVGTSPSPSAGEDEDPGAAPVPVVPLASEGAGRLFTWRNAVLGGVGAAVVLGIAVGAYFLMRTTGIGPAASLVAQGVIAEGEPVVLAEFENTSNDAALGGIVTEALRVDLGSAHAVSLVSGARVREALGRMARDPDEPLTASIAYEVAARDGIKAVIEGEVGSAGSGYILVARIGTADGTELATFRRTARTPDDLIPAIDGLSQDIREKAGESLLSIRAEEPLQEVTTSSLEALRKYAEAEEVEDRGEHLRAKALLEEALELDPEFAMAWRRLAVSTQDAGGTREEAIAASTRAYELRHRLTERERYIATAYYHDQVTGNHQEQEQAYRAVLEQYPDDGTALNNLSILLSDRGDFEGAVQLLTRAVSGPGATSSAFNNLVHYQARLGDVDGARATLELISQRDVWWSFIRFMVASVGDARDEAHGIGAELLELPEAPPDWRHFGLSMPGYIDVARGRIAEAREHFDQSAAAASADGMQDGVFAGSLDIVEAELMVDPEGPDGVRLLRDLLENSALEEVPATERDYGRFALLLARAGLPEAASAVIDDWEAAGSYASGLGGLRIDDVRDEIRALSRVSSDPAAGAEALRILRGQRNCPRCFARDVAGALDRAGDVEGAISEYELARSVPVGPAAWIAAVRSRASEDLGRLYESAGDPVAAAEHYRYFVHAWSEADARFQPRVEAARTRLQEIESSEE